MRTHITTASSHRIRELPVISHGTFHATSVGTISTSPEYRCLVVPEKSEPVAMNYKDSDSDQDNLIITSVDTADFRDMLTLV